MRHNWIFLQQHNNIYDIAVYFDNIFPEICKQNISGSYLFIYLGGVDLRKFSFNTF